MAGTASRWGIGLLLLHLFFQLSHSGGVDDETVVKRGVRSFVDGIEEERFHAGTRSSIFPHSYTTHTESGPDSGNMRWNTIR